MTTLRRERRQKFEEILNAFSDKLTRAEIEATAELLADAAESRTEKLTPAEIAQVDKKVDAIIGQAREAQSRIDSGTGWRGRELITSELTILPYADWYHSVTGWQMYGTKAKPKMDSTALSEFRKWYENDLTFETLKTAYDVENDWRKSKSGVAQNITHPRELTAKAIAIQAAPKSVQSSHRSERLEREL